MKYRKNTETAINRLMARHASSIPTETKKVVIRRSQYTCEECGCQSGDLTMHHLRYFTEPDQYGDSELISGKETPDDIELLCWDCHKSRHRDPNGDYWHDPQEMEGEWAQFHNSCDKDD